MRILKFIKSFTLWELLKGFSVTGRYFISKKVTIQYPAEEMPTSPRFRGQLGLRRYDNGEERCIACKLCECVCPALAISIESMVCADGSRRTTKYDIDIFKCINCGFCEQACPVDAIVLTREMHFHQEMRGDNIYHKEKLLAIGQYYEESIRADREEENKQ